MKCRLLILLLVVFVRMPVYSQTKDSISQDDITSQKYFTHVNNDSIVPVCYVPIIGPLSGKYASLDISSDTLLWWEYRRGHVINIIFDTLSGKIRRVYETRVRHRGNIEYNENVYIQIDDNGQLSYIGAYRKKKEKGWRMEWDSKKKRYK